MDRGRTEAKRQKQTRSNLFRNPWFWLGVAWILGLVLGYSGLYQYAWARERSTRLFDLGYLLLQLITLESGALQLPIPWELEIARFALPALAAWTLVRTAMVVFREQATRLSLWFWRDQIIVCGLGHKGYLLATDFLDAGYRVVVIEKNANNEAIYQVRKMGAIVLRGDATEEEVLREARIVRASTLVAVLGDDGLNAEVVVRADAILCDLDRQPLHCIIHIVDPDHWEILRTWEFAGDCLLLLRLDLFNIYQRGAELMLADYPVVMKNDLQNPNSPSVIVVGLGLLGQHLIVQIAERWFRNREEHTQRIELAIVDREASPKLDLLQVRHPRIRDAVSLFAYDIDVRSAEFLRGEYLKELASIEQLKCIFICMDNDPLVLSTALTMRRQLSGVDTTIVMRTFEENGLMQLVRLTSEAEIEKPAISEFLLVERTCTRELLDSGTHEKLARALHETYLRSHGEASGKQMSLPEWEDLSQAIKNANRSQADRVARLLAEAGYKVSLLRDWGNPPRQFSDQEIETLAMMEHTHWCEEKKSQGWRQKDGPKDERLRTHPDLVEWERLPEPEREKNRAPMRDLPRILHEAGFIIQ